ncbi:MAG: SpoIIE family protein phosphatase [Thaumarchaeota archaeon]|nr:SpoIIE family protein phosphatase [Nitrososphaerota archaeon]
MVRYDVYSESNSIGPGHSENQDSYFADLATLVFAVADGVGGYQGGKEASEQSMAALRNKAGEIQSESSMKSCLEEIHEQLLHTAKSLNHQNMGTTIAVAKVLPNYSTGIGGKIVVGNAGDSPILFFPASASDGMGSDSYRKVSADDSLRDQSPGSMWGVTQYLGIETQELRVHTSTFDFQSDDTMLICSDGVSDNLLGGRVYSQRRSVGDISELVRRSRSAQKIVEEALHAGIKPDDMTALLVFL